MDTSCHRALASEVASPNASLRGLVQISKSTLPSLLKSKPRVDLGLLRTFWSRRPTADEAAPSTRAEVDSRMMDYRLLLAYDADGYRADNNDGSM